MGRFLFSFLPLSLFLVSQVFANEIPEKREFPIDPTKNPCDNFYEYACSKTIDSFKLREDRSRHTFSFSDSHERLLKKKELFLQSLPKQKNTKGFRPSLRANFMACMDTKARATEERAFVADTLEEIRRIKTRDAFLDYLALKRRDGRSFVGVGASSSKDNPDYQDFYFYAHMMSLPERSYYKKEDVKKDYIAYMTSFFRAIGYKKPNEAAKKV